MKGEPHGLRHIHDLGEFFFPGSQPLNASLVVGVAGVSDALK